jgi:RNA polymerase sigma factor (sigma-70 family)
MREPASDTPAAVTGIASDRASAFQDLAERHLDSSYRLAHAILANQSEAQDAVHDAFVTAWQKWASLRDPAKADAWFKRVVINTCRDRLRRRARTAAADISDLASLATPDAAGAITQRLQVEQALARLKPDDRVLLALRHDHDLKVADIANLLGMPAGTVKWRLNRAHKRLRALLEQSEGSSR